MQRATATILCALGLTACASNPPPVLILPPADLAICAEEPPAPALPERDGTAEVQRVRDEMMLEGYLALRSAFGDCKAKVRGLATWREENGG